jgi:uncharacterized protein YdaU (DUF1376 family)
MHFYQQNIADYRKKTMGLSPVEHGIYRMLMDTYYLTEHPLDLDMNELMRSHSVRTADEQNAFKYILKKYFKKTPEGYRNSRCDKEIESFYEKSEKARQSAKARWAKEHDANAMRTHSDGNADGMLPHNPITPIPHNPITQDLKTQKLGKSKTIAPMALLATLGIDVKIASDWITLRKAKKAPVTETAIRGITKQAEIAGMSLENVLRVCCERGWTGFKAEWIQQPVMRGSPGDRDKARADDNERVKEAARKRIFGESERAIN